MGSGPSSRFCTRGQTQLPSLVTKKTDEGVSREPYRVAGLQPLGYFQGSLNFGSLMKTSSVSDSRNATKSAWSCALISNPETNELL